MIVKISFILSLALPLSSLDAVTATLMPRSGQLDGRDDDDSICSSGDITYFNRPPGSTFLLVFCYLMCAVIMKSGSNSFIDSIAAIHVKFLFSTIRRQTSWDIFIFSGPPITKKSYFSDCFLISVGTSKLRTVMNGCGLAFTVVSNLSYMDPIAAAISPSFQDQSQVASWL